MAQFVGATRQVRKLQQQQGMLGHFFSPNVVDWLNESHDPEVLRPRQCDITTLVCDLRGFSRRAEKLRHKTAATPGTRQRSLGRDDAKHLSNRTGLSATTRATRRSGFWGWPIDSEEGPLPACRAALMIQEGIPQSQEGRAPGPLADMRIGIGIAHGRALAGKIGTEQHAKVGTFGPVVERGFAAGITHQNLAGFDFDG